MRVGGNLYTDFHCHVLPELDDGARDTNISNDIINCLTKENVSRIIATPHFYPHKGSISEFIKKREASYYKLITDVQPKIEIRLGAEVYAVPGISNLKDINKLCIDNTNAILLEMPYAPFSRTLLEEIYNLSHEYQIIFAHIERYLNYADIDELFELVSTENYCFQFNCESLIGFMTQKKCLRLLEYASKVLLGSDTHNDLNRAKSYKKATEIVKNKFGAGYINSIIETSNDFFK